MFTALKQAFNRLSFLRQFLLAIIGVLLAGMLTIGFWIGHQIETSAISHTAAISAVYLESLSAEHLHGWEPGKTVDAKTHDELDRVFVNTSLQREVLKFNLWDANGWIGYSSNPAQTGLRFPIKDKLAAAFAGQAQAQISNLEESDNLLEQAHWQQLLEVYVPIRSGNRSEVIAVAEFHLSMDNLKRDILAAQQRSWALVAVSTLAIFLFLFGLARRADHIIRQQQRDLQQQLGSALDESEHLRKAGVTTTTLNEEFLIRIAADLHDGPAQSIAFALMRFDELVVVFRGCTSLQDDSSQELRNIHCALESALRDVRKISSGLAIPGLADMSLANTVWRAVRDFEHLSGQTVQTEVDETLGDSPLSVRNTVYRLLQESLTNCWRHARGCSPQVHALQNNGEILVIITDQGEGFDPQSVSVGGRLGLSFMRERVRLLGGILEIGSARGRGTCIRARIPRSTGEITHA